MKNFKNIINTTTGEAGTPPVAARVHSVETCGTVDGPGLRYVAFFQGCPLRCKYCHNPDTWSFKSGTDMTANELISDIIKYKSYMQFSGGGFTASGGEPLMQAEFITELFRKLKELGIHTAIDTSGYCNSQFTICNSQLLSFTDLVLLDIKSIQPEKYRELTGTDLQPTLNFAEYLNKNNIPVWLRYVIVPGLTDDSENAEALAKYAKGLKNIERIELLPFHKMGEHKWEELGVRYSLGDTPPPTDEAMERLKEAFTQCGLPVV